MKTRNNEYRPLYYEINANVHKKPYLTLEDFAWKIEKIIEINQNTPYIKTAIVDLAQKCFYKQGLQLKEEEKNEFILTNKLNEE